MCTSSRPLPHDHGPSSPSELLPSTISSNSSSSSSSRPHKKQITHDLSADMKVDDVLSSSVALLPPVIQFTYAAHAALCGSSHFGSVKKPNHAPRPRYVSPESATSFLLTITTPLTAGQQSNARSLQRAQPTLRNLLTSFLRSKGWTTSMLLPIAQRMTVEMLIRKNMKKDYQLRCSFSSPAPCLAFRSTICSLLLPSSCSDDTSAIFEGRICGLNDSWTHEDSDEIMSNQFVQWASTVSVCMEYNSLGTFLRRALFTCSREEVVKVFRFLSWQNKQLVNQQTRVWTIEQRVPNSHSCCTNCWCADQHHRSTCEKERRCGRCGEKWHLSNNGEKCTNARKCLLCTSTSHSSFSCDEFYLPSFVPLHSAPRSRKILSPSPALAVVPSLASKQGAVEAGFDQAHVPITPHKRKAQTQSRSQPALARNTASASASASTAPPSSFASSSSNTSSCPPPPSFTSLSVPTSNHFANLSAMNRGDDSVHDSDSEMEDEDEQLDPVNDSQWVQPAAAMKRKRQQDRKKKQQQQQHQLPQPPQPVATPSRTPAVPRKASVNARASIRDQAAASTVHRTKSAQHVSPLLSLKPAPSIRPDRVNMIVGVSQPHFPNSNVPPSHTPPSNDLLVQQLIQLMQGMQETIHELRLELHELRLQLQPQGRNRRNRRPNGSSRD